MLKLDLNGEWRLNFDGEALPAIVPGSVYSDLLSNGRMDDPFWRDNELKALELMSEDYTYERDFEVPDDFLSEGNVYLHCDGLDTLAEIIINGSSLAKTDNMHRRYVFEIKNFLKAGANTIRIIFSSPTEYIAREYERRPIEGSTDAMRGFSHLRKAHCMFGWDWGPRLPDAGIWRDIYLTAPGTASIDDIYVRQEHVGEKVILKLELDYSGGKPHTYLFSDSGELITEGCTELTIDSPKLWWPNGYGEQYLYTLKVDLCAPDGEALDSREMRIGLRTVTVSREKDEWGEEFAIMVNGLKIFAMGADYIPEDNLLSRTNPQRTRELLEDCIAANFNCIRIWGGGIYPPDYFFDICDELGLLVWQDFMFACAMYELTPDFERTITAELEDNIKRLRNHASLALWCGNNEMEMMVYYDMVACTPKQKSHYIQMYEYLFPKLAQKFDPDRFYWPSSPSSEGGFDEPNDPDRGDVHYWDVWHGLKPFTEYRKFHFRFASEFGFQSFPSISTIESFTLPEDRNIFSYVMEKHQRNSTANGRIMSYLGLTYLYPNNLETLVYASQLLQAEAIHYGVTHWRRNRGRCMGAIYWQLNDCWPVASWASIEYFGRWKALHYFAKRFFAPVLISCEESQLDINPNAQPYIPEKSARLCVSNETGSTVSGEANWMLCDSQGNALESGTFSVNVEPYSSLWLDELKFPDANVYENYLAFSFSSNGTVISSGSVLFCPPKHFMFKNPGLALSRQDNTLTVSALTYARSVEIYPLDGDAVLSDNFFDLNADSKTVEILRGSASSFGLRSVFDIGRL